MLQKTTKIHGAVVALLFATAMAPATAAEESRPVHRLGKRPAPLCVPGYVWREAYAGDVVCVAPPRRGAVHAENSAAASRVEPGGGAYGPDTCVAGFVWRDARPGDHVCVPPESRALAAGENARAPQLWVQASPCGTPENCQHQAQQRREEVDRLRQRLAQRQSDLAKERENTRRIMEQLRKDDEAWARAHPGLGRSTQPSIADNAAPIERDIRELEKALREAEQQASLAQAHAQATRR